MPWGDNSLRVQSSLGDRVPEGEIALIHPEITQPEGLHLEIQDERHAFITNGKITAKLLVQDWENALQNTFYNQKGEPLLHQSVRSTQQAGVSTFLPAVVGHMPAAGRSMTAASGWNFPLPLTLSLSFCETAGNPT